MYRNRDLDSTLARIESNQIVSSWSAQMAEAEKLASILNAVARSIHDDWSRLETHIATREQQASILHAIDACAWEIADLRARINGLPLMRGGMAA